MPPKKSRQTTHRGRKPLKNHFMTTDSEIKHQSPPTATSSPPLSTAGELPSSKFDEVIEEELVDINVYPVQRQQETPLEQLQRDPLFMLMQHSLTLEDTPPPPLQKYISNKNHTDQNSHEFGQKSISPNQSKNTPKQHQFTDRVPPSYFFNVMLRLILAQEAHNSQDTPSKHANIPKFLPTSLYKMMCDINDFITYKNNQYIYHMKKLMIQQRKSLYFLSLLQTVKQILKNQITLYSSLFIGSNPHVDGDDNYFTPFHSATQLTVGGGKHFYQHELSSKIRRNIHQNEIKLINYFYNTTTVYEKLRKNTDNIVNAPEFAILRPVECEKFQFYDQRTQENLQKAMVIRDFAATNQFMAKILTKYVSEMCKRGNSSSYLENNQVNANYNHDDQWIYYKEQYHSVTQLLARDIIDFRTQFAPTPHDFSLTFDYHEHIGEVDECSIEGEWKRHDYLSFDQNYIKNVKNKPRHDIFRFITFLMQNDHFFYNNDKSVPLYTLPYDQYEHYTDFYHDITRNEGQSYETRHNIDKTQIIDEINSKYGENIVDMNGYIMYAPQTNRNDNTAPLVCKPLYQPCFDSFSDYNSYFSNTYIDYQHNKVDINYLNDLSALAISQLQERYKQLPEEIYLIKKAPSEWPLYNYSYNLLTSPAHFSFDKERYFDYFKWLDDNSMQSEHMGAKNDFITIHDDSVEYIPSHTRYIHEEPYEIYQFNNKRQTPFYDLSHYSEKDKDRVHIYNMTQLVSDVNHIETDQDTNNIDEYLTKILPLWQASKPSHLKPDFRHLLLQNNISQKNPQKYNHVNMTMSDIDHNTDQIDNDSLGYDDFDYFSAFLAQNPSKIVNYDEFMKYRADAKYQHSQDKICPSAQVIHDNNVTKLLFFIKNTYSLTISKLFSSFYTDLELSSLLDELFEDIPPESSQHSSKNENIGDNTENTEKSQKRLTIDDFSFIRHDHIDFSDIIHLKFDNYIEYEEKCNETTVIDTVPSENSQNISKKHTFMRKITKPSQNLNLPFKSLPKYCSFDEVAAQVAATHGYVYKKNFLQTLPHSLPPREQTNLMCDDVTSLSINQRNIKDVSTPLLFYKIATKTIPYNSSHPQQQFKPITNETSFLEYTPDAKWTLNIYRKNTPHKLLPKNQHIRETQLFFPQDDRNHNTHFSHVINYLSHPEQYHDHHNLQQLHATLQQTDPLWYDPTEVVFSLPITSSLEKQWVNSGNDLNMHHVYNKSTRELTKHVEFHNYYNGVKKTTDPKLNKSQIPNIIFPLDFSNQYHPPQWYLSKYTPFYMSMYQNNSAMNIFHISCNNHQINHYFNLQYLHCKYIALKVNKQHDLLMFYSKLPVKTLIYQQKLASLYFIQQFNFKYKCQVLIQQYQNFYTLLSNRMVKLPIFPHNIDRYCDFPTFSKKISLLQDNQPFTDIPETTLQWDPAIIFSPDKFPQHYKNYLEMSQYYELLTVKFKNMLLYHLYTIVLQQAVNNLSDLLHNTVLPLLNTYKIKILFPKEQRIPDPKPLLETLKAQKQQKIDQLMSNRKKNGHEEVSPPLQQQPKDDDFNDPELDLLQPISTHRGFCKLYIKLLKANLIFLLPPQFRGARVIMNRLVNVGHFYHQLLPGLVQLCREKIDTLLHLKYKLFFFCYTAIQYPPSIIYDGFSLDQRSMIRFDTYKWNTKVIPDRIHASKYQTANQPKYLKEYYTIEYTAASEHFLPVTTPINPSPTSCNDYPHLPTPEQHAALTEEYRDLMSGMRKFSPNYLDFDNLSRGLPYNNPSTKDLSKRKLTPCGPYLNSNNSGEAIDTAHRLFPLHPQFYAFDELADVYYPKNQNKQFDFQRNSEMNRKLFNDTIKSTHSGDFGDSYTHIKFGKKINEIDYFMYDMTHKHTVFHNNHAYQQKLQSNQTNLSSILIEQNNIKYNLHTFLSSLPPVDQASYEQLHPIFFYNLDFANYIAPSNIKNDSIVTSYTHYYSYNNLQQQVPQLGEHIDYHYNLHYFPDISLDIEQMREEQLNIALNHRYLQECETRIYNSSNNAPFYDEKANILTFATYTPAHMIPMIPTIALFIDLILNETHHMASNAHLASNKPKIAATQTHDRDKSDHRAQKSSRNPLNVNIHTVDAYTNNIYRNEPSSLNTVIPGNYSVALGINSELSRQNNYVLYPSFFTTKNSSITTPLMIKIFPYFPKMSSRYIFDFITTQCSKMYYNYDKYNSQNPKVKKKIEKYDPYQHLLSELCFLNHKINTTLVNYQGPGDMTPKLVQLSTLNVAKFLSNASNTLPDHELAELKSKYTSFKRYKGHILNSYVSTRVKQSWVMKNCKANPTSEIEPLNKYSDLWPYFRLPPPIIRSNISIDRKNLQNEYTKEPLIDQIHRYDFNNQPHGTIRTDHTTIDHAKSNNAVHNSKYHTNEFVNEAESPFRSNLYKYVYHFLLNPIPYNISHELATYLIYFHQTPLQDRYVDYQSKAQHFIHNEQVYTVEIYRSLYQEYEQLHYHRFRDCHSLEQSDINSTRSLSSLQNKNHGDHDSLSSSSDMTDDPLIFTPSHQNITKNKYTYNYNTFFYKDLIIPEKTHIFLLHQHTQQNEFEFRQHREAIFAQNQQQLSLYNKYKQLHPEQSEIAPNILPKIDIFTDIPAYLQKLEGMKLPMLTLNYYNPTALTFFADISSLAMLYSNFTDKYDRNPSTISQFFNKSLGKTQCSMQNSKVNDIYQYNARLYSLQFTTYHHYIHSHRLRYINPLYATDPMFMFDVMNEKYQDIINNGQPIPSLSTETKVMLNANGDHQIPSKNIFSLDRYMKYNDFTQEHDQYQANREPKRLLVPFNSSFRPYIDNQVKNIENLTSFQYFDYSAHLYHIYTQEDLQAIHQPRITDDDGISDVDSSTIVSQSNKKNEKHQNNENIDIPPQLYDDHEVREINIPKWYTLRIDSICSYPLIKYLNSLNLSTIDHSFLLTSFFDNAFINTINRTAQMTDSTHLDLTNDNFDLSILGQNYPEIPTLQVYRHNHEKQVEKSHQRQLFFISQANNPHKFRFNGRAIFTYSQGTLNELESQQVPTHISTFLCLRLFDVIYHHTLENVSFALLSRDSDIMPCHHHEIHQLTSAYRKSLTPCGDKKNFISILMKGYTQMYASLFSQSTHFNTAKDLFLSCRHRLTSDTPAPSSSSHSESNPFLDTNQVPTGGSCKEILNDLRDFMSHSPLDTTNYNTLLFHHSTETTTIDFTAPDHYIPLILHRNYDNSSDHFSRLTDDFYEHIKHKGGNNVTSPLHELQSTIKRNTDPINHEQSAQLSEFELIPSYLNSQTPLICGSVKDDELLFSFIEEIRGNDENTRNNNFSKPLMEEFQGYYTSLKEKLPKDMTPTKNNTDNSMTYDTTIIASTNPSKQSPKNANKKNSDTKNIESTSRNPTSSASSSEMPQRHPQESFAHHYEYLKQTLRRQIEFTQNIGRDNIKASDNNAIYTNLDDQHTVNMLLWHYNSWDQYLLFSFEHDIGRYYSYIAEKMAKNEQQNPERSYCDRLIKGYEKNYNIEIQHENDDKFKQLQHISRVNQQIRDELYQPIFSSLFPPKCGVKTSHNDDNTNSDQHSYLQLQEDQATLDKITTMISNDPVYKQTNYLFHLLKTLGDSDPAKELSSHEKNTIALIQQHCLTLEHIKQNHFNFATGFYEVDNIFNTVPTAFTDELVLKQPYLPLYCVNPQNTLLKPSSMGQTHYLERLVDFPTLMPYHLESSLYHALETHLIHEPNNITYPQYFFPFYSRTPNDIVNPSHDLMSIIHQDPLYYYKHLDDFEKKQSTPDITTIMPLYSTSFQHTSFYEKVLPALNILLYESYSPPNKPPRVGNMALNTTSVDFINSPHFTELLNQYYTNIKLFHHHSSSYLVDDISQDMCTKLEQSVLKFEKYHEAFTNLSTQVREHRLTHIPEHANRVLNNRDEFMAETLYTIMYNASILDEFTKIPRFLYNYYQLTPKDAQTYRKEIIRRYDVLKLGHLDSPETIKQTMAFLTWFREEQDPGLNAEWAAKRQEFTSKTPEEQLIIKEQAKNILVICQWLKSQIEDLHADLRKYQCIRKDTMYIEHWDCHTHTLKSTKRHNLGEVRAMLYEKEAECPFDFTIDLLTFNRDCNSYGQKYLKKESQKQDFNACVMHDSNDQENTTTANLSKLQPAIFSTSKFEQVTDIKQPPPNIPQQHLKYITGSYQIYADFDHHNDPRQYLQLDYINDQVTSDIHDPVNFYTNHFNPDKPHQINPIRKMRDIHNNDLRFQYENHFLSQFFDLYQGLLATKSEIEFIQLRLAQYQRNNSINTSQDQNKQLKSCNYTSSFQNDPNNDMLNNNDLYFTIPHSALNYYSLPSLDDIFGSKQKTQTFLHKSVFNEITIPNRSDSNTLLSIHQQKHHRTLEYLCQLDHLTPGQITNFNSSNSERKQTLSNTTLPSFHHLPIISQHTHQLIDYHYPFHVTQTLTQQPTRQDSTVSPSDTTTNTMFLPTHLLHINKSLPITHTPMDFHHYIHFTSEYNPLGIPEDFLNDEYQIQLVPYYYIENEFSPANIPEVVNEEQKSRNEDVRHLSPESKKPHKITDCYYLTYTTPLYWNLVANIVIEWYARYKIYLYSLSNNQYHPNISRSKKSLIQYYTQNIIPYELVCGYNRSSVYQNILIKPLVHNGLPFSSSHADANGNNTISIINHIIDPNDVHRATNNTIGIIQSLKMSFYNPSTPYNGESSKNNKNYQYLLCCLDYYQFLLYGDPVNGLLREYLVTIASNRMITGDNEENNPILAYLHHIDSNRGVIPRSNSSNAPKKLQQRRKPPLPTLQTDEPYKLPTVDDLQDALKTTRAYKELFLSLEPRARVCNYPGCKFKFANTGVIIPHFLSHTQEFPYKCTLCEDCFRRRDDLKSHILKHYGIQSQCPYCSYKNSKRYVAKHIKSKHKI